METQDFKVGWVVKIYDHRMPHYNGSVGKIIEVKKHVVWVSFDGTDDVISCMAHELIVTNKNGWY